MLGNHDYTYGADAVADALQEHGITVLTDERRTLRYEEQDIDIVGLPDAEELRAEGQALLRSRWQVEPTVAWLVRYQGCRQARRVGLAAAQCQLYQACAVRNLLLWLSRKRR